MRFQSFLDVAKLSTPDQDRLLAEGDPPERVWATWAIAARLDHASLELITGATKGEAHPGVKRHLIVVLAGAGKRNLLREIAESEPDSDVRATACQYLIRSSILPDAGLADFLLGLLWKEHDTPVIRAILDFLPAEIHPIPADALSLFAASPDRWLILAVMEYIERLREVGESLASVLEQILRAANDAEISDRAIQLLLSRGYPQAVIHALTHRLGETASIVDRLPLGEHGLTWSRLLDLWPVPSLRLHRFIIENAEIEEPSVAVPALLEFRMRYLQEKGTDDVASAKFHQLHGTHLATVCVHGLLRISERTESFVAPAETRQLLGELIHAAIADQLPIYDYYLHEYDDEDCTIPESENRAKVIAELQGLLERCLVEK